MIAHQAKDPEVAEHPAQHRIHDLSTFSYHTDHARDIPKPHRELVFPNYSTNLNQSGDGNLVFSKLNILNLHRCQEPAELKKEPASKCYRHYGHAHAAPEQIAHSHPGGIGEQREQVHLVARSPAPASVRRKVEGTEDHAARQRGEAGDSVERVPRAIDPHSPERDREQGREDEEPLAESEKKAPYRLELKGLPECIRDIIPDRDLVVVPGREEVAETKISEEHVYRGRAQRAEQGRAGALACAKRAQTHPMEALHEENPKRKKDEDRGVAKEEYARAPKAGRKGVSLLCGVLPTQGRAQAETNENARDPLFLKRLRHVVGRERAEGEEQRGNGGRACGKTEHPEKAEQGEKVRYADQRTIEIFQRKVPHVQGERARREKRKDLSDNLKRNEKKSLSNRETGGPATGSLDEPPVRIGKMNPTVAEELPGDRQPHARIATRFLAGAEGKSKKEDAEEEVSAIELPLCPRGLHHSLLLSNDAMVLQAKLNIHENRACTRERDRGKSSHNHPPNGKHIS